MRHIVMFVIHYLVTRLNFLQGWKTSRPVLCPVPLHTRSRRAVCHESPVSHERTGVNERLHLPTWLLAAVLTSLTGYGIESPTTLTAAEPAREFLDALRSANYFDTALDYLDELASSPLTPTSLKEVLTYERGLTLLKGASYQRDGALREKQLDEAQKALNEFIAQLPDHLLNTAAKGDRKSVV